MGARAADGQTDIRLLPKSFERKGILTVNMDTTSGSPWIAMRELRGGQLSPGTPPNIESRPSGGFDRGGFDSASDSEQAKSSIVGDPAETDAIEFRVSRAGESRRRLRLTGNRYTFGNADGCTIRLNDPALRPLHAVLIREGSRVLIRTYSVPVEVNGHADHRGSPAARGRLADWNL